MHSTQLLALLVFATLSSSQSNCARHFIFGLDRSASMSVGSPNSLWDEVNDFFYGPLGFAKNFGRRNTKVTAFMFNESIIEFPPPFGPIVYEEDVFLPLVDEVPAVETNLDAAIMKAAVTMLNYPKAHT